MPATWKDEVIFAVERAIAHRVQLMEGRLRRLLRRPVEPWQVEQYDLMRSDNASATSLYQADECLAAINSRMRDYIYAGTLRELRNSRIARWLGTPTPNSREIYRSLLWLYYTHVKAVDTDGLLGNLEDPTAGGTWNQEIIDGRAVSLDFLKSIEDAYAIRKGWELMGHTEPPRLVVELGGGYGRLAYVCRRMMPNSTYVILDLPEALACAYSWLTSVLPNGEVISYQEARTLGRYSGSTLLRSPVWILGAQTIEQLDEADAFVCVDNFVLMSKEAVANYFTHIDRIAKLFYSKQTSSGESQASYPVPPHWKQLFRRTTSLYDDWIELAYKVHR